MQKDIVRAKPPGLKGKKQTMKKWISAVLAGALALSLAACTFKTPATVLTMEDVQIPAGLYLMEQFLSYNDAQQLLSEDKKQVEENGESTPVADWVHEKTLESLRVYLWTEVEFATQELAFTDEESAAMESSFETYYANNEELLAANGIGKESYRDFYMNQMKYQKLYTTYAETASDKISDADAKAYMDEEYARVQTLILPTVDGEYKTLDEAKVTVIQGYADEVAAALEKGGDFDKLAEEYLKKALQEAGREYTEDLLGTAYSASFQTKAAAEDDPEGTAAKVFALGMGKTMVDKSNTAPIVYQRIANYDADTWAGYRDSIVGEMTVRDFENKAKEESAGYTVQEDASAVRTYSVKKIKLSV